MFEFFYFGCRLDTQVDTTSILIRAARSVDSELGIRGDDEEGRLVAREMMQHAVKNFQGVTGAFVGQPQENDAAVRLAALKHEFAEVFVLGDQDAVFSFCLRHDRGVRYSRGILADPGHIVALTAQSFGRGTADILIQK